jgi:hypothetical protein
VSCRIRSTNAGEERVSRLWIRHNPRDAEKASGSSQGLNWAILASRAVSISSAFSSPSLPADVGAKSLFDQPGQGTRPRKQRFYHDLLLADPEDRSREGREDYVGPLKLKMPANLVQNSNGAHQSDMIHNPTFIEQNTHRSSNQ